MWGVCPNTSFPLSLAQVHIDCRGPGTDGGGVPSLSSLGGELGAFLSSQDPDRSQKYMGLGCRVPWPALTQLPV